MASAAGDAHRALTTRWLCAIYTILNVLTREQSKEETDEKKREREREHAKAEAQYK